MNSSDRRYDQNAREPRSPLLTGQQSNFLHFIAIRYQAGFRSSFTIATNPEGGATYSTMQYEGAAPVPVTIDSLDLDYLAQINKIIMRRLSHSLHRVMPTASGIKEGVNWDSGAPDLGQNDIESDMPLGVADRTSLIKYRLGLLVDYMTGTGVSEHAIYSCAGPGTHSCHKPDFYDWKRGELPTTSQAAISLERFLEAKQPPPGKKSKRN